MTASEKPMAPWAFRAALSGLSEEEVRDILEGERCPQPDPIEDDTEHVRLENDDLVVFREESEEAWLQSDEYAALADVR